MESSGGDVWVAEGVFSERIALKSWVHVFGGFAGSESERNQRNYQLHPTVLDGKLGGTVVNIPVGTGVCRVDGFTIQNGTGVQLDSASWGGGVFCSRSSPILANNTIRGNTARVGGGIHCYYGSPMILNSRIIANVAELGGGIYCSNTCVLVFGCLIGGNSADNGGGIYGGGTSQFIFNDVIVGNQANSVGGGIGSDPQGNQVVADCTLTANAAPSGSAFYKDYHGEATLANCIVWGNDGPPVIDRSQALVIKSCDIEGGPLGTGGITAPPSFVRSSSTGPDGTWGTSDDDYGDLRLRFGSPCIDTGSNAAVPPDALDLDGDGITLEPTPFDAISDPRFLDDPNSPDTGEGSPPIVDMGAYEMFFLRGDFNLDGRVDPADGAMFSSCTTGPAISYLVVGLPEGCVMANDTNGLLPADLDHDHDVDQSDFGLLQQLYGSR